MFVGYKRLKIQPFNEDGTKKGELIIIEGKQHKGATTTAEISGLAKDSSIVAGSNIDYYIARGGLGEVKVALGILDLPEDSADVLSGFRKDENGITYGGSDTMPPYCSIELESTEDTGEIALIGFFKGVFTRDKLNLETLDSSKTFKPEPDAWSFKPGASMADDSTNGEVMQKFIGDTTKNAEAITVFEKQLFDPAISSGSDVDGGGTGN